jgi:tetratricopeptide (TPR) repeat protein
VRRGALRRILALVGLLAAVPGPPPAGGIEAGTIAAESVGGGKGTTEAGSPESAERLNEAERPGGADSLLAPSRRHLESARLRLGSVSDPFERAGLLLAAGRAEEAQPLLPALLARGDPGGQRLAAKILRANSELELLRGLVDRIEARSAAATAEEREIVYDWLFLIDDLAGVEERLAARARVDAPESVELQTAGRLRRMLLQQEAADSLYARALSLAASRSDSAAVFLGWSQVAYKRLRFEESLDRLRAALSLEPLDPDALMALSNTLIRLARTSEAIDAAELAVEIAPLHEDAHYLLGNGYARHDYTQLFAAWPQAFADSTGRIALARADAQWVAGNPAGALARYDSLRASHPGWADVLVRLGSLAFSEGRAREAISFFRGSLALCPAYGRAHNGLAKALEAERFRINLHRPAYERRFAETKAPEIPGIERFVVNWHALSDRHKKSVALSIAPWKRFIPVLVEGGSIYYIKPLYEILSETPGQQTLRDQRIGYDARLWDDVRGCGGYRTVTGIEDVERTILNQYNTVLHELTHQVHGVLTADRGRQIRELYRRTKEREERSGAAFLSQYASGSVWEYFAEGANSFQSPRRDGYDTREIVRERLEERDAPLRALVDELMVRADVESCYAVALVNRGQDALERGAPLAAIESYRAALRRDPVSEPALGAIAYALLIADSARAAFHWAERGHLIHPRSGDLANSHARALWHAGRPLAEAARWLQNAASLVDPKDSYLVDLELGGMYWTLGQADSARAAYERVLRYQSDEPQAIWGLAVSHALDGRWQDAWTHYERALRARSGIVGLRDDLARDLLRAGETVRAREQIGAALLLDPREPRTLALEAWLLLEEAKEDSARTLASRVLERAPWCDLARLVLARAHAARGDRAEAAAAQKPYRDRLAAGLPSDFVYRPESGRYEEIHVQPAVERELLVLPELGEGAPRGGNQRTEGTR